MSTALSISPEQSISSPAGADTHSSKSHPRDPYQPYRKTLLPPQRVRELSRIQSWRPVVDTTICWGCIVACWAMAAHWPVWWVIAAVIPIIGARYYALLIIGHDAIHRRLFATPWINDLFADVFVFGLIGAITRINNKNHLRHHRYLSTPNDPDMHQFTCTNKYQWHLLLGYLTGATSLYKSLKKVFWDREPQLSTGSLADSAEQTSGALKSKTDGHDSDTGTTFEDGGDAGSLAAQTVHENEAVSTATTTKDPDANKEMQYRLTDFFLIGLLQLAMIGGLTWTIGWWAWPVLWLFPIYVFAFLADNFRAFAEHSQLEPDELADDHRLISFSSNPVERFFVSPLNMNYHAAHHLWPSIPYYHLPTADREIRTQNPAGLEWRGAYLGFLWRYWVALPLRDCFPSKAGSPH